MSRKPAEIGAWFRLLLQKLYQDLSGTIAFNEREPVTFGIPRYLESLPFMFAHVTSIDTVPVWAPMTADWRISCEIVYVTELEENVIPEEELISIGCTILGKLYVYERESAWPVTDNGFTVDLMEGGWAVIVDTPVMMQLREIYPERNLGGISVAGAFVTRLNVEFLM